MLHYIISGLIFFQTAKSKQLIFYQKLLFQIWFFCIIIKTFIQQGCIKLIKSDNKDIYKFAKDFK